MARTKKVLEKTDSKLKGQVAILMTKEKQYREKAQQLTDENTSLKKQVFELNKLINQITALVTAADRISNVAKGGNKSKYALVNKSAKTRKPMKARKSKINTVAVNAATAPKKRGRPRKAA